MDENDDIFQGDAEEAEDLDWLGEGTYCSVNATPKASVANSVDTSSVTSTSNGKLLQNDDRLQNKTVPCVLPSKQTKEQTSTENQVVKASQCNQSLSVAPNSHINKLLNVGETDSGIGIDIHSEKYLTISQRIVRTLHSGVKQVIRVLVPHEFLKKHKDSCAKFKCPRCSTISNDLQSLDDHMISMHDIDNAETGEGLTIGESDINASDNQLSKFSCSLCSRSLPSMQEWHLHLHMHLTSRMKRVGRGRSIKSSGNNILDVNSLTMHSEDATNDAGNNVSSPFNDSAGRTHSRPVIKRGRGRPRKSLEIVNDDIGGGSDSRKCMVCKLCSSFTYTKQGELKRHMLSEHGDQLHKCKHCEMAFPLGFELLRHIRLYHPGQPVKKNPPTPKKRGRKPLKIRLAEKKPVHRVKLRPASDEEVFNDDGEVDIVEVQDGRKRAKAVGSYKVSLKKRRLVSDSEGEDDADIIKVEIEDVTGANASPENINGGPADRIRSHPRKSTKPVKKTPNYLTVSKSKSSKRRVITDDESSSDNESDLDWKRSSTKSRKATRRQPVRVSADEVRRVTGQKRKSSSTGEPKERKSGLMTVCDHCGNCYEKRKELIAHIVNEHSDKMLKCTSCPKSFALHKSLKVHVMACHSEQMFSCRRCDMKFVTLSRLQRHIRIDHLGRPVKVVKTKPYGCTFCGKMFQTKQILDGHTNQHHLNLRPYKCSKCGVDFAYVNNFKMHERTCMKSMICELCGENFAMKSALAEHQKTVHNIVMAGDANHSEFFCDHCNKDFPNELALKCHLARVGSAAQRSSVLCDICGKECKKAAGLTMHKAYCHPNEVNPAGAAAGDGEETPAAEGAAANAVAAKSKSANNAFSVAATPVTCDDCGKVCQTSTSLRIHRTRMHSSAGPRRSVSRNVEHNEVDMCCPTCGQMCKGKVGLSAHLRSHAPAVHSEAKCDKCNRVFDNKLGLDMHRRHAHTDTRKYRQAMPCSCPICSKEFPREGPMKLHMAVVHGLSTAKKKQQTDKVFECHLCGHQFKMKAYLQRHMRMHAGVKPYICTVCNKCFTSSTNLAGHMAALHKDIEYTYNPLVNMVCNVAVNGELPAMQQAAHDNLSVPRKTTSGASRKASNARKNSAAAATAAVAQQTTARPSVGGSVAVPMHEAIGGVSREEQGFTPDVLNMTRDMQLMPRDMSGMVREIPVMAREIPGIMSSRDIPVMAAPLGMPRDLQNVVVARDMSNMPRDMSNMPREFIVPRENPNMPQYAIGTMPTNWNYAYMGEFYRL